MATDKQGELFKAETTWFHVFKNLIDSGDLAAMGPHAFTVYCVIKSYTNFATGHAFPSLETVAEKSGVSLAQVKREIKALEALGYIGREKQGRKNIYTLREKVAIADHEGRPVASATWDYLPSSVRDAVADLKNVLVSGDLAGARVVHIERLTFNVQTGANSTQINLSGLDDLAKVNPKMAEKIRRLINSSHGAGSE